jgi:succinyl-diaminopimelate desuccinylase
MESQRLLNTLIEILRIESVTGNEQALCDLLHQRYLKLPILKSAKIKRVNNSFLVFGPVEKTRQTICLAGHLDTVSGTGVGAEVSKDSEKIIGLGSSDMKGGVAIMCELLEANILSNSNYNLVFIFYEAEEGDHQQNGLHPVLAECPELKQIDLAFFLEPTNLAMHLGCLGGANAEVTVRGKRAHSARPWEGDNAFYRAIPLLQRLSELQPIVKKFGELEYVEVISATLASGGEKRNIVPDSFVINLNARSAPGTTPAELREKIKQLVGEDGEINFIDEFPSGLPPAPDNQLFKQFEATFNLPKFAKQAYTDVGLFAEHGIQALNFGPGLTAQAHQRGEFVPIENMLKCHKIYEKFLLK